MKSIVTEYNRVCTITGKPAECEHHLIFGNGKRPLADEDGLIIYLTHDVHNMAGGKNQLHDNPVAEALSKMLGQVSWEKQKIIEGHDPRLVREDFRKRYGKSYL